MMMMYPEEPIWAIPPIHGLEDDGDYRGKRDFLFFFFHFIFFSHNQNHFLWVFQIIFHIILNTKETKKNCLKKKNSSDEWTRQGLESN